MKNLSRVLGCLVWRYHIFLSAIWEYVLVYDSLGTCVDSLLCHVLHFLLSCQYVYDINWLFDFLQALWGSKLLVRVLFPLWCYGISYQVPSGAFVGSGKLWYILLHKCCINIKNLFNIKVCLLLGHWCFWSAQLCGMPHFSHAEIILVIMRCTPIPFISLGKLLLVFWSIFVRKCF